MIDKHNTKIGDIVWYPGPRDAYPFLVWEMFSDEVYLHNIQESFYEKYRRVYKTKEEALQAKLDEYDKKLQDCSSTYIQQLKDDIEERLQECKEHEPGVRKYRVEHYFTSLATAYVLADSKESAIQQMKDYEDSGVISIVDAPCLDDEHEYDAEVAGDEE